MACGKPPVPGGATPAREHSDFALSQVEDIITDIEAMISRGDLGEKLDRGMRGAERAIDRLRAAGATDAQIRSLEGKLGRARVDAKDAMVREAEGLAGKKPPGERAGTRKQVPKEFTDIASERAAQRARDVLTKSGHWAHEAFKKDLLRSVERGAKIPDRYKEVLTRDAARLLKVCPKAGGLVTAMISRGQKRDPFAARLSSGNKSRAVGAAYEIMGTSALCEKGSKPANTKHQAPELRIDPTKDKLSFGSKSHLNHRYSEKTGKTSDRPRSTTEGDAQFFRTDRGEVAIDFKHASGERSVGISKLRNELKAVAEQIGHGQYNEFHFVTNGKFSGPFKEAVDKVNDLLIEGGHKSMEGLAPIAVHERVSSIDRDPHSDKEP